MFPNPNSSANQKDMTSDPLPMPHQCDINVKYNDQQGVHAHMPRMQSPIFNIHIHVPPYQPPHRGEDLKMYLPRIQPVIHLHFDELVRKLNINTDKQDEGATYRAIQKMLAMTSPRFGNVKFHYQNNPNEVVNRSKEFQSQDQRSETVYKNRESNSTAPSFSLNNSNDAGPHASKNSGRLGNQIPGNCGMPDCCGSQNSVEDNEITLDDSMSESESDSEETLKQKFNLKEAVVVLEDVRKTEYYKNMVAAGLIRDSFIDSDESESDDDDVESAGGQENMITSVQDNGNCYIKRESESYTPEYGSSSRGKAFGENINTNPLNPPSGMLDRLLPLPTGLIQNRSNIRIAESSEKTLSALAEGCNFSDILSRFQVKKSEDSDDDSVKCIEDITESEGLRSTEGYNQNERVLQNSSYDGPVMWRTIHSKDNTDRSSSQSRRTLPVVLNPRRRNTNEPSGSQNKYKEIGPEATALRSPSKENLDGTARTSQQISSKRRLEMISTFSPKWHKRLLMFPETRENKLVNMGVSGFRLDVFEEVNKTVSGSVFYDAQGTTLADVCLMTLKHFPKNSSSRGVPRGQLLSLHYGKLIPVWLPDLLDISKRLFTAEMDRSNNGRTGRTLKKKTIQVKSSPSKKSTPSKKMKRSDDESKKSRIPSEMEDYIPLQASGPTKFAVAPLNKVSAYKSHDARNFKADMLYGKRINRFSSSDQLRIYKLKQEAAKTQTN